MQALFDSLSQGACVPGPREILCDLNTKKLGALYTPRSGTVDTERGGRQPCQKLAFVLSALKDTLLSFDQTESCCTSSLHSMSLTIVVSSANLIK